VITRDNVPAGVNAVAYFRVIDSQKAIVEVENYLARHLADLADGAALGARQGRVRPAALRARALNEELQKIIDESTEPWGVKVTAVEIKDVEIPEQMQRAMRARPRPSASGGARSSTPRASSRRPEAHRRRRHHQHQPGLAAAALPADAARDRRNQNTTSSSRCRWTC
jgi:regulator of protease activity HflC (stomatin/prohibitin superfamily)